MKYINILSLYVFVMACQQPSIQLQSMQLQIDSLQQKLNGSYKSGLGEFMVGIQMHHAKLWFAGTNSNWKLADFEVQEIHEALDDVKKYITDRPETKKIDMIFAPLDSISDAIRLQNQEMFRTSFISLTGTCNNCHRATEHAFNVITIPTSPPVTNQDFKPVLQ
jgi:hypothetical protein